MIALSLQRRGAINSRSKHSLESQPWKGHENILYRWIRASLYVEKNDYAFSQTGFYHKTNPNLFWRRGSDQKFLVEHLRSYPKNLLPENLHWACFRGRYICFSHSSILLPENSLSYWATMALATFSICCGVRTYCTVCSTTYHSMKSFFSFFFLQVWRFLRFAQA